MQTTGTHDQWVHHKFTCAARMHSREFDLQAYRIKWTPGRYIRMGRASVPLAGTPDHSPWRGLLHGPTAPFRSVVCTWKVAASHKHHFTIHYRCICIVMASSAGLVRCQLACVATTTNCSTYLPAAGYQGPLQPSHVIFATAHCN